MIYDGFASDAIRSLPLAEAVLADWGNSLNAADRKELELFVAGARENRMPTVGP